ncbi:efflux RND transporter periplasmic adaptor subunit [Balneola sp. EhC07]|uniref:efflux RND transporter periplasmic adaptor subunit n=1 Tax=Balneola sp. EhC07 TaxID=1849360 RepID=UPI0009ED1824|nr:efflux RND transporter periplasmic adaptor subunit [Balneola sp. EhC07]
MRKILTIILPLLFLISCSKESQDQQRNQGNLVIPAVEAVQSQFGSLPLVERFSGNVVSENQVELYPEVNAQIAEVYVENGDFVNKGDVLVKLQDEPFQKQLQQSEANLKINNARLKQAKAQLSTLEAQYKRIQALAEKDLSSELELEQINAEKISAEADVELAEAQVEQSAALVDERKNQLTKTLIKAPVTGTIGQRNAQPGMQASASTPLFMIGDLSKLRVEILLTESMLNKIKVGQTAAISVTDQNGEIVTISGELSRISPFLNEITRSTEAEIDIDNQNGLLNPGMYVPVDIFYGESQQATLIPTSAIFIDPNTGSEGIYIANSIGSEIKPVSDSASGVSSLTSPTDVTFQEIDVIARGKMEVAVNGLESGKWVVTLGQNLLSEGRVQARVKTIPWEHVIRLQQMQREDLLNDVMKDKQQTPEKPTL